MVTEITQSIQDLHLAPPRVQKILKEIDRRITNAATLELRSYFPADIALMVQRYTIAQLDLSNIDLSLENDATLSPTIHVEDCIKAFLEVARHWSGTQTLCVNDCDPAIFRNNERGSLVAKLIQQLPHLTALSYVGNDENRWLPRDFTRSLPSTLTHLDVSCRILDSHFRTDIAHCERLVHLKASDCTLIQPIE